MSDISETDSPSHQPALPIRLRATRAPATGYTCPRCGTRFGTLRAFDNHRDDERKQR